MRVNLHIENVLKKSYCRVSPYSRLILFHARDHSGVVCVCVCVLGGGGSLNTPEYPYPQAPQSFQLQVKNAERDLGTRAPMKLKS